MHGQINNLVDVSVFPLRGASWTVLPYLRLYQLTNWPDKFSSLHVTQNGMLTFTMG